MEFVYNNRMRRAYMYMYVHTHANAYQLARLASPGLSAPLAFA